MLNQGFRIFLKSIRLKYLWIFFLLTLFCAGAALGCLPGRGGGRRRGPRKLTPLVFKQHVPNVAEDSLAASGPSDGRISRNSSRFKLLVPNYNEDIIFKDEEGTGVDRLMTKRCKETLDTLAISVMNQWPGVRLRVTEGFDEEGHHSPNSLHYSGRAVDITTSDRDRAKYGMLARLAVEAGFSWVYYESRGHIHCSVKSDSVGNVKTSGCFHGSMSVSTKNGTKKILDLKIGDEVISNSSPNGSVIYSPVISFIHKDYDVQTIFINIQTNSNSTLLVTPNHLIFKQVRQNLKTVFGHELRIGDEILAVDSDNTLTKTFVTDITILSAKGVFAPLTTDGTIVVNNILVSCYALIHSHELAHAVFLPIRANYALKQKGLDLGNIFQV